MVTAATVTTLSKKAQKARRVRKAGEESSLSSTDSESGRPVTRSQGVRKVAVPVNTRKGENKRQAVEQAAEQAEAKPVKIKRRASANQQRSTSKNKDVKELGRVIANDEKDCTRSREAEKSGEDAAGTQSKDTMGMAATMQRLTRAVAELQASTKEVHGADKEGQHGHARGKYRRRVQRVRRVPSEDGEPDEQSNDEDQHGAELMASTAVSSGTAPNNHVDMTAMASAIQTLTTVVAKLQPAPSRTQRFQAGRRVLRRSGSSAGEARHNGDSGDSAG
ncbi:hypothetical protein GN958_ATG21836 [Phytophthora infestans]|uniref:Uncharacterized protein n=1 Tax=Phytophthora infestans TaxID=4787 RepID=A0A8S9TKG3_PHYIN|nr:hypothetical protein GN958_ATG21836 [Phytophthora infestans]